MSRRKKKESNQGAGSPGWKTTFADLMSLLLTFFILLYSMSSMSNDKFQATAHSLSNVFTGGDGILDGIIVEPLENQEPVDTTSLDPELLEMYNRVTVFVEQNNLGDKVSISADSEGVYVNMNNAILFGKESASLSREGRKVLESVAQLLNSINNQIIVEGHTDNIPNAYGQYPTNWELSVSRAVSVLRYLSEEEKVDPRRLSAVGHGEYKPLVSNDTAENRTKNRRVNIVVVYEREEGTQ